MYHMMKNSNNFSEYFKKATVVIEKDPKIRKTKLKNKQFETVKHKFGSLKIKNCTYATIVWYLSIKYFKNRVRNKKQY